MPTKRPKKETQLSFAFVAEEDAKIKALNLIPTRRFKFTCSYDGTAYFGWQVQPGKVNIQGTIEETLATIVKVDRVKIHGSGRTDQGVHARGQVFHCDLVTRMTARSLLKALNSRLPTDIRILSCTRCKKDFHARRDATSKEYRYRIWNTRITPPDRRLYHTTVPHKLNLTAMRQAIKHLIGAHDFGAFAANGDRPMATTVRTIYECSLTNRGSQITFAIRGSGFLYKMVRGIMGFLIRVGSGQEKPDAVIDLLKYQRHRTARIPSAPPRGLTLWHVWYTGEQAPNPHFPQGEDLSLELTEHPLQDHFEF